MADGKRRVLEISEIMGEKDGKIITKPLVEFKVDKFEDGVITGHWEEVSEFSRAEVLKDRGVEFPGFVRDGDEV